MLGLLVRLCYPMNCCCFPPHAAQSVCKHVYVYVCCSYNGVVVILAVAAHIWWIRGIWKLIKWCPAALEDAGVGGSIWNLQPRQHAAKTRLLLPLLLLPLLLPAMNFCRSSCVTVCYTSIHTHVCAPVAVVLSISRAICVGLILKPLLPLLAFKANEFSIFLLPLCLLCLAFVTVWHTYNDIVAR